MVQIRKSEHRSNKFFLCVNFVPLFCFSQFHFFRIRAWYFSLNDCQTCTKSGRLVKQKAVYNRSERIFHISFPIWVIPVERVKKCTFPHTNLKSNFERVTFFNQIYQNSGLSGCKRTCLEYKTKIWWWCTQNCGRKTRDIWYTLSTIFGKTTHSKQCFCQLWPLLPLATVMRVVKLFVNCLFSYYTKFVSRKKDPLVRRAD
jgi:hypothetical protein